MRKHFISFASAALALAALATATHAAEDPQGKATYEGGCIACHASGVAGAPKVGDAAAWAPRIKTGLPALYASALKGKGAMPAKGGNTSLADAVVQAAVRHMVSLSDGSAPAPAAAAPAAAAAAPVAAANTANTFNRLLRAPGKRNLPPTEDTIHDPENDGTQALQPPLTAFNGLPRSNAGNRIDWVKALGETKIAPRADRLDPAAMPMVMDLNIVREVKGSMPDVVYPHKQHTEWLDCSNCHPAIFIPQKGANQISMASILLGQKCGVCHGKVAFPVSECRLCHSKPKATATAAAAASAPN